MSSKTQELIWVGLSEAQPNYQYGALPYAAATRGDFSGDYSIVIMSGQITGVSGAVSVTNARIEIDRYNADAYGSGQLRRLMRFAEKWKSTWNHEDNTIPKAWITGGPFAVGSDLGTTFWSDAWTNDDPQILSGGTALADYIEDRILNNSGYVAFALYVPTAGGGYKSMSGALLQFDWVVSGAPQITSFTPEEMPLGTLPEITITGVDFDAGTMDSAELVGDATHALTGVVRDSATQIRGTVPANVPVGTYTVRVTIGGTDYDGADDFTATEHAYAGSGGAVTGSTGASEFYPTAAITGSGGMSVLGAAGFAGTASVVYAEPGVDVYGNARMFMWDFHDQELLTRDERVVVYDGSEAMFLGGHALRMPAYFNYAIAGSILALPPDFNLIEQGPVTFELLYCIRKDIGEATNSRCLVDFPGAPNDTNRETPWFKLSRLSSSGNATLAYKTYSQGVTPMNLITKSLAALWTVNKWNRIKIAIAADGSTARVMMQVDGGAWSTIINSASDTPTTPADTKRELSAFLYLLGTDQEWAIANVELGTTAYGSVAGENDAPGMWEIDFAYAKLGHVYDITETALSEADTEIEHRFGQSGSLAIPFIQTEAPGSTIYAGAWNIAWISGGVTTSRGIFTDMTAKALGVCVATCDVTLVEPTPITPDVTEDDLTPAVPPTITEQWH